MLRVYPPRFGKRALELMPELKSSGEGQPELPEGLIDGPQTFQDMTWDHELDWDDARMLTVLVYLKGNKNLRLPERWKAVFPRHI